MSSEVYLVSETLKYSDGSEKVVTFKLPEVIEEDEIDAEIVAKEIEEEKEVSDPLEGGIPKEVESTLSDETE